MLLNIWHEFIEHLQKFTASLKTVEGGMKTLGSLIALVFLGLGFYHYREWLNTPIAWVPTYAAIPAGFGVVLLIVYLTLLINSAREPRIEIGDLTADNSSPSFDVKVKNLGPGKIKPTVTITYLRDGEGKQFRDAPESYQPREAHWRHASEPNWHPTLKVGQSAESGVIWVDGVDTVAPVLCTYPNELRCLFRLWPSPIHLDHQKGIQITIIASYIRSSGRDAKRIERSYKLIPDKNAQWKYRVERVKGFD